MLKKELKKGFRGSGFRVSDGAESGFSKGFRVSGFDRQGRVGDCGVLSFSLCSGG